MDRCQAEQTEFNNGRAWLQRLIFYLSLSVGIPRTSLTPRAHVLQSMEMYPVRSCSDIRIHAPEQALPTCRKMCCACDENCPHLIHEWTWVPDAVKFLASFQVVAFDAGSRMSAHTLLNLLWRYGCSGLR